MRTREGAEKRAGIGRVSLEAKETHVIPVFIKGIEGDLLEAFRKNWWSKETTDICIGPHVDVSDLQKVGRRRRRRDKVREIN